MVITRRIAALAGGRSLRRALVVRTMAMALSAMFATAALFAYQSQRESHQRAQDDTAEFATLISDELTNQFATWRQDLLIAAGNTAYRDWFEQPENRRLTTVRINNALVALHDIEPGLIDESCFIAADGRELARQTKGEIAPDDDLSPDESEAAFFAPSFALREGEVWQGSPYVSEDSGRWVVSNSTPLTFGGKNLVILHFEANLDAVRSRVVRQLHGGMQVRIVDTESKKVIADTAVDQPIVDKPLTPWGEWAGAAGPIRASADVGLGKGNANAWTVEVSRADTSVLTGSLLLELGLLVVVGGVVLSLITTRFGRGISAPMEQVTEVAEAMAAGDLTRRTDVRRADEIGRMAAAVNLAIDTMSQANLALQREHEERREQLRNTQEQQRRAEEDVRRRAQEIIDQTAAQIAEELDRIVEHVREVQDGAETISHRVGGTGRATRSLVDQAGEADTYVEALGESLRKVGGIAEMIAGVASQTNLLALNATIEANRAGEAGQGFRVVADEVKSLAGSTSRSTGEISATIATIEDHARSVATVIATMAGSVNGIDEATADVVGVTHRQNEIVAAMQGAVSTAVARVKALTNATSEVERRTARRVPFHGEGLLIVNAVQAPIAWKDISIGGMAGTVRSDTPVRENDKVTLEFVLVGRQIRVVCTVQRLAVSGGLIHLGLGFIEASRDLRDAIATYFEDVLGSAEV